jgi:hypothetical protein
MTNEFTDYNIIFKCDDCEKEYDYDECNVRIYHYDDECNVRRYNRVQNFFLCNECNIKKIEIDNNNSIKELLKNYPNKIKLVRKK